jgi:hypothetical protein
MAPQQRAGGLVVAVAEDVGFDADSIADDPLGRISPSVDLRLDPLDDCTASTFLWHLRMFGFHGLWSHR